MSPARPPMDDPSLTQCAIVTELAEGIGARRPTSAAERDAADLVRDALSSAGLEAEIEPFRGYASFGYLYGAIASLASAPALMPNRWRAPRALLAVLGAGALVAGDRGRIPNYHQPTDTVGRSPAPTQLALV